MKKRSVTISGHRTSISLESPFWDALKTHAENEGVSVNALITRIDDTRDKQGGGYNLSSALRIFILQQYQQRLSQ
jgi:predicted DNA-binding ribbon-helix-helix protein